MAHLSRIISNKKRAEKSIHSIMYYNFSYGMEKNLRTQTTTLPFLIYKKNGFWFSFGAD